MLSSPVLHHRLWQKRTDSTVHDYYQKFYLTGLSEYVVRGGALKREEAKRLDCKTTSGFVVFLYLSKSWVWDWVDSILLIELDRLIGWVGLRPSTTTLEALGLILEYSVPCHSLQRLVKSDEFDLILEECFYILFLLQRLSTCPRPFKAIQFLPNCMCWGWWRQPTVWHRILVMFGVGFEICWGDVAWRRWCAFIPKPWHVGHSVDAHDQLAQARDVGW